MPSHSVLEAGLSMRITKSATRYYAAVDGMAMFGTGESLEKAVEDLDRRYRELIAFADETGLRLDTLVGRQRPDRRAWTAQLRTALVVIACFGVLMLPLSYALSTALERTALNLHLNGGREFWRNIENSLVAAADSSTSESTEARERTLAAVRALVHRVQPYVGEIKPLFGCSVGEAGTQR
jgi:hypothetical protein